MTKKELSQLYYLNREIELETSKLAELRALAQGATSKITGLPHCAGISDKTAIAALIAESVSIIEVKQKLAIIEYNRISRFAYSVDDSLIRQIIHFRYINGLSWTAVAMNIGGGNTADSVRKALDRWLKNNC